MNIRKMVLQVTALFVVAGEEARNPGIQTIGKTWKALDTQLKMAYTFPHFMGYRFALFNYATKITGGAAAFDFFHITDTIKDHNIF